MIKRNGFKTIMTILIGMVLLVISTLPVLAATHVNEINILDGYVVQIKNPTNQKYEVTVKILYQDENGNTIYEKEVTNSVKPFGTTTIDARDYYNSEKSQKVLAEIIEEYGLKKEKEILLVIIIILNVINFICLMLGFIDDENAIYSVINGVLGLLIILSVILWNVFAL